MPRDKTPPPPVEHYTVPRLPYADLPPEIRAKYPPSKALFAGDAIAEREGLLPPSRGHLYGWRCASKAKGSQGRCSGPAVAASLVCRAHGANQPKGAASPQYRHGGRSQALPLRLQAQYQAAVADPELLSLRQDLGVLELRVTELLQRLATGETGALWERIGELATWAQLAATSHDAAKLPELLGQIQETVTAAQAETGAWEELRGLLRDRAQIATLEHKRLQEVQGTVPVEALLALLGHLVVRLQSILHTSLEAHLARHLLGQFQAEIVALQQHGLQAPKLAHKPATAPRLLEPGTRRTVGYTPGRGAVLDADQGTQEAHRAGKA